MAVAERKGFSAAARVLGVSPSALSQAVRTLERQVGTPLLVRTTRAVNLTQAGERLHARVWPALQAVREAMGDVNPGSQTLTGRLRLNVPRIAIETVLRPVLAKFCRRYPEVDVDIAVNEELVDIVTAGFDAGIRLSEAMERDMTAVRLTKAFRFVVVGSPGYLKRHGRPRKPEDLLAHECVQFRYPTAGTIYRWELEKDGRSLELAVHGRLSTNNDELLLQSAVDGLGLAYVPEPAAALLLKQRRLELVLPDWAATVPGLFLYFPRHARTTPTLRAFLDTARQLLPR